jgi:hypothetical protein
MDAVIERKATQQRAVAQMHLGWALDRLRLHAGLVEVVPRDEDPLPRRRLFRNEPDPAPERPTRFLPTHVDADGQGWGVLIREVQ